ncbi:MAG TPA: carboxy terminal-processing peptidase [Polyangia bacterium]|nr:carboxy terminal-processing peptidase [Polyangia bacterium]
MKQPPRRPWFWSLPAVLALTLAATLALAGPPAAPDRRATEANITRVTTSLLASSQLSHHPLDEQLASKLLDRYMDALDGTRSLFLRADVDELAPLRATLAQATRLEGDTTPAHTIFARFLERLRQQVAFDTQLLHAGHLDFKSNDRLQIDREHAERPRDLTAAHELWKKQLRAEYLEEKLGDKPPHDIAAALIRRHELQLKNMSELDDEEVLEIYLDALTHVYDPHSDYLDKESMESLSISMNLSLFGIGATLETEDGLCTIRELVPGGPAALSGALKPGDRIIAVAQATGAPVDVTSMPLTRIVELIRGPKGTLVTLTISPPVGASKTVRLTRAEVKLEDQKAKARLVDLPRPGGAPLRLGIIDLPSFYSGADNNGSHGATADVARLVAKLQAEKVRGLVLDLRHNGGGSLQEAIDLASLFVGGGPVVQTRDASNAIEVDADKGASARYGGPLVVLISRFSASASEIVAGALQDYGRAVVVGDPSTFGKGTVQTIMPLAEVMDRSHLAHAFDPGALKLTVSKFYRPSGASTELRGVASDILIPAASGVVPVGESKLADPLPWDTVPSARFKPFGQVAPYLPALRDASTQRVAKDPAFDELRQELGHLRARVEDASVSLNEAQRRRELARDKEIDKAIATKAKAEDSVIPSYEITVKDAGLPGLPPRMAGTIEPPPPGAAKPDADPDEPASAGARAADSLVLDESLHILADYVGLLAGPPPAAPPATRPGALLPSQETTRAGR